ncbi:PilZ domain-containing protein [Humisphaera borealis]|uniref:PilZ domain-containing protein n=1 Tax=Humisphaera borealis TaxID=2807512 RepID=A0A7M2X249_9BACT|nr:PilZ domain-containing protein [Humisphaera borealis]QOV91512.1 PilZ domain-containing protein [Humisphaera borealis]
MNLSAETFLQIIKSLRSDDAGTAREQRKKPRVGVRGRSSIMLPAKSGTRIHPVSVRDISANGIGLLMTEPLVGIGEEFVLMLPSAGQQSKRQMLCAVTRFNKLSANLYSVGASYKHEVAENGKPLTETTKAAAPRPGSAEQISKELLADADLALVNDLEDRLKRMSA